VFNCRTRIVLVARMLELQGDVLNVPRNSTK